MRIPPLHEPVWSEELREGAIVVAQRNVEVGLTQIHGGKTITLAAGTRVRHEHTDRSAECIPDIEYADVHFVVLDGPLAGQRVVALVFDLNRAPDVPRLLEMDGLIVTGEA